MNNNVFPDIKALSCNLCESGRRYAMIDNVFDMLTIGIACVRRSGELMYANRPAFSMLDRFGLLAGKFGHSTADGRLNEWGAKKLCLDFTQTVVVSTRDSDLQIQVEPFHGIYMNKAGVQERRRGAMLILREPGNIALPSMEQLRSLYGLTQAEARLALALCSGNTVAACAENLGVTVATVRTHLRAVMEKTGSRRQAELLARLLSAPSASIQMS